MLLESQFLYYSFYSEFVIHFQAKQLDVDPRACIGSFFDRIQVADIEYKKHFDLEVKQFKERITKRAAEKIEEALAEQEVRKEKHNKFWIFNSISIKNVQPQLNYRTEALKMVQ